MTEKSKERCLKQHRSPGGGELWRCQKPKGHIPICSPYSVPVPAAAQCDKPIQYAGRYLCVRVAAESSTTASGEMDAKALWDAGAWKTCSQGRKEVVCEFAECYAEIVAARREAPLREDLKHAVSCMNRSCKRCNALASLDTKVEEGKDKL